MSHPSCARRGVRSDLPSMLSPCSRRGAEISNQTTTETRTSARCSRAIQCAENYGSEQKRMTLWQQWISRPQTVWLRKAIFQVHLWCGISIGLYILVVSTTGSIVVYRNELYRAATPKPITVVQSGPRLTYDELKTAAVRAWPGYS